MAELEGDCRNAHHVVRPLLEKLRHVEARQIAYKSALAKRLYIVVKELLAGKYSMYSSCGHAYHDLTCSTDIPEIAY